MKSTCQCETKPSTFHQPVLGFHFQAANLGFCFHWPEWQFPSPQPAPHLPAPLRPFSPQAVHKNNYVSGIEARWLKKNATGDFFFFILATTKKIPKNGQYFLTKKKNSEKKNCGRLASFNFSHPLDRKQTFFYGQPHIYVTLWCVTLYNSIRVSAGGGGTTCHHLLPW